MGHYLFGFRGRINRAKLWAFILIVIAFWVVACLAVVFALGPRNIADVADGVAPAKVLSGNAVIMPVLIALGAGYVALIWAAFAVAVKRLHDRGKSAWWLLVFYVLPALLNVPRQAAFVHSAMDGTLVHMMQQGSQLGGPIATIASGAASLIYLWAFVELYCLRGTVGDNRYGPDPLAA